jgi:hypothetical protein
LEREYLFIDVISTFLRAVRVGAIHIHHGAVVLAHYGRLEISFDTCSKVIVDMLREESIMSDNPDVIVTTITQALQEVSYFLYGLAMNLNLESSPTPLFLMASSVMIATLSSWPNFFPRALLSEEVNYPFSVAWIINTLSKFILTCFPGLGNASRPTKITRIRNPSEPPLDSSES